MGAMRGLGSRYRLSRVKYAQELLEGTFMDYRNMRPSELLNSNKEKIRRVVESNNARNPRVFGSVLHRTDREGSDIDLLVDPIRGVTTLLDIAGIQIEVEELLGVPVDVLTPSALPEKFRDQVLREAVPVA